MALSTPNTTDRPEQKKFVLRIDNELHERISALATKNRRSLNSQIIVMLEELAEREEAKAGEGSAVRREGRNTPAHLSSKESE